jgi:uncharacterized protein (TIGR00251 family)
MTLAITEVAGGFRFTVQVQPRASRSEVTGLHGEALRVRLQAPPVDGAANEALVAFLAESLGARRRDVRLVAGMTSRAKVVEVLGVPRSQIERLAAGPRDP